jgi:HD-GYP domain-containing protein (c-di-GMP phosphodiesterase class II)
MTFWGGILVTDLIVFLFIFIQKDKTQYIPFLSCFNTVVLCSIILNEILISKNVINGILLLFIILILHLEVIQLNPFILSGILLFIYILLVPNFYQYTHSVLSVGLILIIGILCLYICFLKNKEIRENYLNKEKLKVMNNFLIRKMTTANENLLESIHFQEDMQDKIIYSIANLVENRDNDTGDHIKRTSAYVYFIAVKAKELGYYTEELTTDFIKLITKAAPMHDLGKIVVPDSILKVPRRLTTEEFEIMKKHTTEGARIIREIYSNIESEEFIDCAANIAYYHHEKYNGSGYPCGLKGEEIPLEARIMAIADVFDALVSQRCYKDAYPVTKAFDMIINDSGTHFDPKLVEAFTECQDDIIEYIVSQK